MKIMKSKNVKISSIAHFLPKNIKTNQEIIDDESLRLKDQWVVDNIGIKQRHWCKSGETASDLGVEVLQKLLIKDSKKLSTLIVSTVSQDFMTPSTACVIQGRATPGEQYPAFDLTAACSGFLYALDTGVRLVQTGHTKVACIASEIRSYFLDKKDRRTVMLFGDGAAGITLAPCEEGETGIIATKLLADGQYYNSIVVTGTGTQSIKDDDNNKFIEMRDATNIFSTAIKTMEQLVSEMLIESQLELEDINYFIFHQASNVIVKKVAENLGLTPDQYMLNFPTTGNMTSASTAVALSQAVEQGKIKKGDIVLMLATGGGFTAGITIFKWEID